MKIKEIRKLSPVDRSLKIKEVKKKLFELKFKQATRQTVKAHLFKKQKHLLAQLLTIEHNYKHIK